MKKNEKLSWLVSGVLLAFLLAFASTAWAETDVTAKVQVVKGTLGYDRLNKQSYQNVSVKNISQDVLLTPIKVVIDSASPSTVTVANADGVTETGKPYFEYITTTGQLLPGATTTAKKLIFSNPTAAKFTYITHVEATIPDAAEVIGPAGGVMEATDPASPANITVEFPPGALAANQTFTIDTSSPALADIPSLPVGPVINLGPSGTFQEPVTITISYDDTQLTQSNIVDEASLRIYTLDLATGIWLPLEDALADAANNTVSATTTHFSTFCVLGSTLLDHGDLRIVQQPPILFVHGVQVGLQPYGNGYNTFGNAIEGLYNEGLNVFMLNYDTSIDITQTAASLSKAVKSIIAQTGAAQVNIIAHSMGGLVSRAYIQDMARIRQPSPPDPLAIGGSTPAIIIPPIFIPQGYDHDIGKLLMLGTPNHGALIGSIPALLGYASGTQMLRTDSAHLITTLNSKTFPSNIVVDVAYGDGAIISDGIVSLNSARVAPEHGEDDVRHIMYYPLPGYFHSLAFGLKGIVNVSASDPDTHYGYRVMEAFALDADNDGIMDNDDSCTATPLDEAANWRGCSITQLQPVLKAPVAGQVVDANNVRLEWGAMEHPDSRLTTSEQSFRYCFEINDTAGNHAEQFCDLTDPAYAGSGLQPNTDYWWAVWAYDNDGTGKGTKVSEWRHFRTAPDSDGDRSSDLTDCRSNDPQSHPDEPWIVSPATDICENGIDEDCSGKDGPECNINLDKHSEDGKFVFVADINGKDASKLSTKVRLLSGEGCWYLATPNYSEGNATGPADVFIIPPYGQVDITSNLVLTPGQQYRLDIDMANTTTDTLAVLDVILRGLFSRRLEDVMSSKQEAIGQLIDIISASGAVSKWDTMAGYLANGEYLAAVQESVAALQEVADSDAMNAIFVDVLGAGADKFWEKGVGFVLEAMSVPTKYYLLKEFADQYMDINPDPAGPLLVSACPAIAWVRLEADQDCPAGGAPGCELTLWYKDADNDGYGDGGQMVQKVRPVGYKLQSELTALDGDFDDTNPAVSPASIEVCGDQLDNNCDGQVDEGCDDANIPAITFSDYDPTQCRNYITWTDEGAPQYHVYWGTSSGVTTGSESMPLTPTPEYGHTGVVPGWSYFYRVASVAADGTESALSEEVEVSVPVDAAQCFSTVTSAGQVWMDRNLGASRVATSYNDPEAYGDLYQWGRGTDGHEKRNSPITSINSSTDNPGHGSFITENVYPVDWRIPQNNNLWQGESGINNPCPAGFRLPTITELEIESASWSSTNYYGAFNSPLKLVAAGARPASNGSVVSVGSDGGYWSSTVYGNYASYLYFGSSIGDTDTTGRARGFSARCISDSPPDFVQPQNVNVVFDPVEDWNYITWDDVPGATEYHVYWGTETGVTTGSELLDPTTTPDYGHTGVLPGWMYCYRVASVIGGIESALSDEKCVTIPEESSVGTVVSAGQVWMDRNLGASRVATSYNDPEAYGDLYQWGRGTDGHEKRTSPITSVNSSTDDPGHGSFITESSSPYDWRIPQNNNFWQGESGINNPCPDGFRLPTDTELETERLSWASNNIAGAFASPLKLVAAGYRYHSSGTVYDAGSYGRYWSSTVNGVYSRGLYFHSGNANMNSYIRARGFSARCLKD